MSFLLRQGQPANDVALYLPNSDAWSSFTAGRVHMIETLREKLGDVVMPQILEAGYGLDFFDDAALDKVGRVDEGGLSLGGNRYRAVVLPDVETIPVTTIRKLERFVRAGGVLIATRRAPSTAPGLKATEPEKADVKAVSERLFGGPNSTARLVARDTELGAALRKALTPDMDLEPAVPEIGFLHRSTGFAEIYFVANTGNQGRSVKATFRVKGLTPEIWDPLTGTTEAASVVGRTADAVTVALDFDPYGSRVVVLAQATTSAPARWVANGEAVDISRDWAVTFRGLETQTMGQLRWWTEDDKTRYFSGTATYSRTVSVPAKALGEGKRVMLDFGAGAALPERPMPNGIRAWYEGPIREAAVITVNTKRAGSLWAPPYEIDIAPYLVAGENRIRIEVGNTALNHMAGRPLPDYRLLNLRYGVRFEPQDMDKVQALPSGIVGPVRLRMLTREGR